jgi:dTDP-4-dehydrorhamnose reductase
LFKTKTLFLLKNRGPAIVQQQDIVLIQKQHIAPAQKRDIVLVQNTRRCSRLELCQKCTNGLVQKQHIVRVRKQDIAPVQKKDIVLAQTQDSVPVTTARPRLSRLHDSRLLGAHDHDWNQSWSRVVDWLVSVVVVSTQQS